MKPSITTWINALAVAGVAVAMYCCNAAAAGNDDWTAEKPKFEVVAEVLDVQSMAVEGLRSEHDPVWQQAIVKVTAASGDFQVGQKLAVRFAGSRDIAWYGKPKLQAGEIARLGLLPDNTTKLGKAKIDDKEVDAYYLVAKTKAAGSSNGVKTYRDVEYAKVGRKSLLLDVYAPAGAAEPLPLIVWIHGGGWRGGDKKDCPAIRMATNGYVVASINYRFTQEAIFPAQIEDCKAAIRFLRGNAKKYSIDPDRVGVWGHSAGGHLAALLGTSGGVKELEGKVGEFPDQSTRVQAVADFSGPADFLLFLKKMTPGSTSPLVQLLGGTGEAARNLGVKASPVTYVGKDAPPFLIVHGDKDGLVPITQAESMRDALKKAGADVTLFVVKGAGHDIINPATIKMTGDFFDKHLRTKAATQPTQPASKPASQPAREE